MANITIDGTSVGGNVAVPDAPTALTATASFDGVFLRWTNPTNAPLDYIEIQSGNVNNRANAQVTTLANVKATAFYDHTTTAETQYYWVRAVNTVGVAGNFNAADTAGVSATPQEVTVTASQQGEVLAYSGTAWINTNRVRSTTGNTALTMERETASTTARTSGRVRKTLTSGSRTEADGPVLAFNYADTTTAYDYMAFRTAYRTSGDHEFLIINSNAADNSLSPANVIIRGNVLAVQLANLEATGSITSNTQTQPMGYRTGSGDSVTQLTDKTTSVTLNRPTGRIITANSSLLSGFQNSFTLINDTISSTDVVIVNHAAGGGEGFYFVHAVNIQEGNCQIMIHNRSGATRQHPIELNFAVIRGSHS